MARFAIRLAAALAALVWAASPVARLSAAPEDADPRIVRLVDQVSEAHLGELLARLEGFGTRHTLSTQESPTRGIGAAAQWIHDELARSSPRLRVSFDTYDIPRQGERITRDVRIRNVMAVLPGRSSRRVYVSAHYDSFARPPRAATPGTAGARPSASGGFDWNATDHDAPGANDDGSGTVATMELARLLGNSGLEFDATIVFILFAGEEQGLVGALLHAQKAVAERWPVDALFNIDMIGNAAGGNGVADGETVRVFSEGPEDSASRQVARHLARVAARYVPAHQVRLVARHDRFGRGGDHTAFNQHGMAAVRITEANEDYARQHTADDVATAVSAAYMAQNTRVTLAAVAAWALAPPAPVVTDDRARPTIGRGPSGYDTQLEWQSSRGAVGYRIFWREAWTPDWQHERRVGDVTEALLPNLSVDDHVFGVAAVGPDGHESAVAVYVNPARPETAIKTR